MPAKKIPSDLLSSYDVMYMFDVRVQAIIKWRKIGFPYYHLGGTAKCPPVRYSLSEVLKWAKKVGKPIVRTPKILKDGKVTWSNETAKFEAFKRGIEL